MSDRSELITETLEGHWFQIPHMAVSTCDMGSWVDTMYPAATENPELSNARFGWTWPILNPDRSLDATIITSCCPDVIAEQTDHLDDSELDEYLRAILWLCDRYIHWLAEKPELGEQERAILCEKELFDTAQGSLVRVTEVQLHALDMASV